MKTYVIWSILILTLVNTIFLVREVVTNQCVVNEIKILPTEKIYMHQFGTTNDPYREDLHGKLECSCVRAVRSFGINIPYGMDASDFEPNTDLAVGTVAIFRTEDYSHIAAVTKIEDSGFWIKEGNYVKCEMTERFIKLNDYRLRGFYK